MAKKQSEAPASTNEEQVVEESVSNATADRHSEAQGVYQSLVGEAQPAEADDDPYELVVVEPSESNVQAETTEDSEEEPTEESDEELTFDLPSELTGETEDAPENNSDDDFFLPELDHKIAEASPEVAKRWEEQTKGLRNIHRKLKETEQQYSQLIELKPLADLIGNPDTAQDALKLFAKGVADFYGFDIAEIAGVQRNDDDYEDVYRDTRTEKRVDPELAAVRRELAQMKQEMAQVGDFKRQQDEARKRQAFDDFVTAAAPKVAEAAQKIHAGFPVDSKMVKDALAEFPQFIKTPLRAVEAKYSREIAKHVAKAASNRHAKKAPDMVPATGDRETKRDLPADMRTDRMAWEIYRDIINK